MPTLLEVIVTSVEEAREAEAGGADRLELVRALELGGLTPPFAVAAGVLRAVSIPVRLMLRENASLSLGSRAELTHLIDCTRAFAPLPIDGFVLGFVANGSLDLAAMSAILDHAPKAHITCHRAFDEVDDPFSAIQQLRQLRQVDRILTSGGKGSWPEHAAKLVAWQAAAAPEMHILAGIGLCSTAIEEVNKALSITEVHVGRAARIPQTNQGLISREQIRELKSALQ
jgi:copper homeostasis protein